MNDTIKLVLGTMTFGPQVSEGDSRTIINHFLDDGYDELDTAYVYNEGETEKILGSILSQGINRHFKLATKIHPRITGRLDAQAVNMQLSESLNRLGVDKVDILYFHFPDRLTPIIDALEEVAKLYEQGKFVEFGLSNFPSWMVVDIWHTCKANGWPKPTVYQGMYNTLSRKVEAELFPALRNLGLRFYAFNPLAGGLLTGKYKNYEVDPSSGRFSLRPNYRNRYWKKTFFEAINRLSLMCEEEGLELAEAAIRWLAFHSFLETKEGDAIILGVSRISHLDQNLLAVKKGQLSERIVNAFGDAWLEVKADCPEYFSFYNN